jgi:hypothetical protein
VLAWGPGLEARGAPPRPYLLRMFVDIERNPPEIVTGYWTSRIEKYRSSP